MELELTYCPECGRPAEVIDRFILPSTDGPIEHVKTRCITGPWFVTPAPRVPSAQTAEEPAVAERVERVRRT